MSNNFTPFNADRLIGTLTKVSATYGEMNLPTATQRDGQWLYGHRFAGGEVQEYVFIETGHRAIFGKINEVKLSSADRLTVEEKIGKYNNAHPIGYVQFLATLDISSFEVKAGITHYPRLGASVYSAHPDHIKHIAESIKGKHSQNAVILNLATIPNAEETQIAITPERLFGRHCAILGSTGGGKSYTLARIIEQCIQHNAKILLLDATGEFKNFDNNSIIKHITIGIKQDLPDSSTDCYFPSTKLTEEDMFALFNPTINTQIPKLRDAIKSLKIAKCISLRNKQTELPYRNFYKGGYIEKLGQSKRDFYDIYQEYTKELESNTTDFDINKLPKQILNECLTPQNNSNNDLFGTPSSQDESWCNTLINRIRSCLTLVDYKCLFQSQNQEDLTISLNNFLSNENNHSLLRISLRYVSYSGQIREIISNAIGRYLMMLARENKFKEKPLVIILDEAHQFINKSIRSDYVDARLDAFDLIAKEGRKYGLHLCLATQRPRDIPDGVLSQIGTFIVHRLTNDEDRKVVERACGEIDRSVTNFLPILSPGEAVIVGVDFPIPVTVKIITPSIQPDSKGSDFQTHWQKNNSPEIQQTE